jgi:hypothetical protein
MNGFIPTFRYYYGQKDDEGVKQWLLPLWIVAIKQDPLFTVSNNQKCQQSNFMSLDPHASVALLDGMFAFPARFIDGEAEADN